MLRVVQVGLGPIGQAIARYAREKAGVELVGAVDPHASIAGRDLGELLGTGHAGICIEPEAGKLLEGTRPDLVIHATGSFLTDVADQLVLFLDRGVSVISTCEELAYPFYRHPELARELNARARESRSVLLGTGINPGFVMDKLVVTLMAACKTVRSVRVVRVVDAARRRGPFQRKILAGLSPAEFEVRRAAGRAGHIGLAESAHMLADVIGVPRDRTVEETLHPILAERPLSSSHVTVEPGQTAGLEQVATLVANGEERVRLTIRMALGEEQPRDEVSIDGSPALEMLVSSGVEGDEGTVAVVVHCALLSAKLEPGLRTMLDVPLRFGSEPA